MKINEKTLKTLIKESIEQMRSQRAISHAGKKVREDGISFEQWIEELISGAMHQGLPIEHEDDLPSDVDYYNMWLSGERSDVALADLRDMGI
jgi:hypothetical protein